MRSDEMLLMFSLAKKFFLQQQKESRKKGDDTRLVWAKNDDTGELIIYSTGVYADDLFEKMKGSCCLWEDEVPNITN